LYRVDNASSATPIPTPGAPGPNPNRYYTSDTVVEADHLNAMQEELVNIIASSPGSPALSKTDRTQVYTAILDIINNATQANLNTNNLFYIEDQKANTTNGGGCTAATQNVRTLNAEVVNNISGASLAANQITLPAGTYWVEFEAPATSVNAAANNHHKTRLRNITDASAPVVGASAIAGLNLVETTCTVSKGAGPFTIAAPKVFELQHYTSVTIAATGLGAPTSSGDIEVYGSIKIWKVA